MGIHICIQNNGVDHPDWDYIRRGHDSDFPGLIDWRNVTWHPEYEGFRPKNIPLLRKRILKTNWDDKNRYLTLLDIIEKDPDYWIHIG